MLRPQVRRVSCRIFCLNVSRALAETARLTSPFGAAHREKPRNFRPNAFPTALSDSSMVEKLLQIDIDHNAVSILRVLLCSEHSVTRATARTESMAVLTKSGVDQRLQHLQNGLLDQSIEHGGYPQFTFAAIRFGDAYATYRVGLVRRVGIN